MNLFKNGIKVHRLPNPDYVTTCSLTSPALGAKEERTTDLVSRVAAAKVLDFPEKHCFQEVLRLHRWDVNLFVCL